MATTLLRGNKSRGLDFHPGFAVPIVQHQVHGASLRMQTPGRLAIMIDDAPTAALKPHQSCFFWQAAGVRRVQQFSRTWGGDGENWWKSKICVEGLESRLSQALAT